MIIENNFQYYDFSLSRFILLTDAKQNAEKGGFFGQIVKNCFTHMVSLLWDW